MDIGDIFDLEYEGKTPAEIEENIQEMSEDTGFELHVLYANVLPNELSRTRRNIAVARTLSRIPRDISSHMIARQISAKDDTWTSVAHIYGYKDDGSTLTLEELNR